MKRIVKGLTSMCLLMQVMACKTGSTHDSSDENPDPETPVETPEPKPEPSPEDPGMDPDPTPEPSPEPPVSMKPRVLVLTDLGQGDLDDTQSLIHMLLYADDLDIEGLIASTPNGVADKIHEVINNYGWDYPKLVSQFPDYPHPDELHSVVRQGSRARRVSNGQYETDVGIEYRNAGSDFIVEVANNGDPRPLNILIWGGPADLAIALITDFDIAGKIRIFSIGGWNTRQDRAGHSYLWNHRNSLTWIDDNATSLGIWAGSQPSSNFVTNVVRPSGNLGNFYYDISANVNICRHCLKEGDTTTFLFLLQGPGWDCVECDQWAGPHFKNEGEEHLNYWQDDRSPENYIGGFVGAEHVRRHRDEILGAFANRLQRLR